uniref:Malectin-like domain-containing protein n=1 Tax=Quercus lobata TaxID=97700 RepID=A0A7N2LMN0_QUELO
MAKHFPFAIILHGAFALTVLVHSQQDQLGFISIDCGIPDDSSYKDGITEINYASDSTFTETGKNGNISVEYRTNSLEQQFWTVRSFPEGTKNCYTLRPSPGKNRNYLIRASFMYGNYDGIGKIPNFDLYLGVNKWDTVAVTDASSTLTKEIMHLSLSEDIYVCLVNTGNGTPFVSVLEERPLNNNTYVPKSRSLDLVERFDCGSQTNRSYNTAVTKFNINDPMFITWTPGGGNAVIQYIYMHFAESENLQPNQSRQCNIFLNGNLWEGSFVPRYLSTSTVHSSPDGEIGQQFQIWINQTETSTLPPILNAVEFYTLKQFLQAQTDQEDVDAIKNIKSIYRIKRNWQGDPCAPKDYAWNGLNCSYNSYDSPSIISLDLSNNSLNGTIPIFLSQLPLLRVLLSGSIPMELIERSNKGLLFLSVGGNPNLASNGGNPDPNPCVSSQCKNKKNIVVPIVAAVVGFAILLSSGIALLWHLKRRKKDTPARELNFVSNEQGMVLESKKQQFTYSEVQSITNNFESVIGKGGFGTVYHGYLDGFQVAVKMLSHSSVQGYKEFQAEVGNKYS